MFSKCPKVNFLILAAALSLCVLGCPGADNPSQSGSDSGGGSDTRAVDGMDSAMMDTGSQDPDTEAADGSEADGTAGDGGDMSDGACQPKSCSDVGAECGAVDDGCGGELDCGTCQDPMTCGDDNTCGECMPESDDTFCENLGASCGEVTAEDNCGDTRTVTCGECAEYETCNSQNACECEPKDDATLCQERAVECGTTMVTGRCGDVEVTCGTCDTHPNSTCENNQCTCKPKQCGQIQDACGVYPDGCGGTVECTSACSDFLATGGYHTCYQDPMSSDVRCWGWNKYGQIGTGSTMKNKHASPQKVSASFNSPTGLTAGEDMTCVVDQGNAKCWGANYHGQALGYQKNNRGVEIKKVEQPTSPQVPGVGIKTIETQVQHTCAITSSDELYCWGFNWPVINGILDGSGSETVKPTKYTFGMTDKAAKVDAGALHTCVESANGGMWCFGTDFFGGIGDGGGRPDSYQKPTKVMGFANGFTQVESGGMDENKGPKGASFMHDFSCAIDRTGAAKCWGSDADGELGNDANKNTRSGNSVEEAPVQVKGLNADVTDLALGGAHACAIQNASVYCWGDNEYGQIGDGTTTDRPVPVKINIPTGARIQDVEAGYYHTCAELSGGQVACWGRNKEGQLGDGSFNRQKTPKVVYP